jgi:hypothetical protein
VVTVLTEVKLYEVSFCVANPAYELTNSQTQIRDIMESKNINLEPLMDILHKEEITDEDRTTVTYILDAIRTLIEPSKPLEPEQPSTPAETEERSIDFSNYFNKLNEQKGKITWN